MILKHAFSVFMYKASACGFSAYQDIRQLFLPVLSGVVDLRFSPGAGLESLAVLRGVGIGRTRGRVACDGRCCTAPLAPGAECEFSTAPVMPYLMEPTCEAAVMSAFVARSTLCRAAFARTNALFFASPNPLRAKGVRDEQ